MRCNICNFFRGLYNASLERQLREPRKVIINDDGFRYPPPSAYEVKQITDEFGLNKHHAMARVGPVTPHNIYADITKG